MLTQLPLSAMRSDDVTYNLYNTTPLQSRLVLTGGGSFNFNSLLKNVVDVKTKNYSIFYLTEKNTISDKTVNRTSNISDKRISTTIGYNNTYVTLLCTLSGEPLQFKINPFYNRYTSYSLTLSTKSDLNLSFTIDMLDSQTCTISYNDSVGTFYMVVSSGDLITLQRSINIAPEAKVFTYILDGNNIVLLKQVGSNILQFVGTDTGELSGVLISDYNSLSSLNIQNPFYIDQSIALQDSSFVRYVQPTTSVSESNKLFIDTSYSLSGLRNNYLLYKNLYSFAQDSYDIIALKNQASDVGMYTKSNSLVLSSSNSPFAPDLRNYTAICNNIDTQEDEGLELSYNFYSKSVLVRPGTTYFNTEKTFTPFTQLNINDTTFVKQGSFAGMTPKYADRVYNINTSNIGTEKILLCTWLYGDMYNEHKVWVDRYYYPDLISKGQALTGKSLYNETYNSFIESLIYSTTSSLSNTSKSQYFDKLSDFVFTPNTSYKYERTDFKDDLLFLNNDIDSVTEGYYNDINNTGGFFLAFDINNYKSEAEYNIRSNYNEIPGGFDITFNSTNITVKYKLFNTITSTLSVLSATTALPPSTKSSVSLNINAITGNFKFFVDSRLISSQDFYPAQYRRLVYGDFLANSTALTNVNAQFQVDATTDNYVDGVYLHIGPLSEDDIIAYTLRQNRVDTEAFYISLPGGLRSNSELLTQLNSFTNNQMSKSNYIDININNMGNLDDTVVTELQRYIRDSIEDIIPVSTNIQTINVL